MKQAHDGKAVETSVLPSFRAQQPFADLGFEFSDEVVPASFPDARLRWRNDRAAASVGLADLTDGAWMAAFCRFEPLPGAQPHPLAMRYHGHQFRTYNPDLGDGRGFLFAQMREAGTEGAAGGRLLDFGTKGSGQTPWSRNADGRLTLKGGVREVLAAAVLEVLGVPTSRAFSLVETGESLSRPDEPSPTRGAVLTRLGHSHIRFGTFQRHAFNGRADLIETLTHHVCDIYYPHIAPGPVAERGPRLLAAVVERTAHLVARWMAAGFVHGVLNTDNMNIAGESFDYGPFRFLPRNDPNFVAAYFDQTGLYSFGRQPEAVFWNLQQLAGCFTLVCETGDLVEALNGFSAAYREALRGAMLNRLGVVGRGEEADLALVNAAFAALAAGGEALRWEPFFFDWFGGEASSARALSGPRAALYTAPAFAGFRTALEGYEPVQPAALAAPYFERSEPEELLYDEIEALWAPIAQADDWGPFNAKLERLNDAREAMGLGR